MEDIAEWKVIELLPDHVIRPALRKDAVTPSNAKRSDVQRILETAAEHADELLALWEAARG